LASLAAGFDRVAARPFLILPPLVLDLFLWLGPRLRVTSLVRQMVGAVAAPPGIDPALGDQLALIQRSLAQLADHFNLFGALAVLPAGIPSLMAGRMPNQTPLGPAMAFETGDPLAVMGIWTALTVIGLGLGALFQVGVARQVAPPGELATGWVAWGRFLVLAFAVYFGLLLTSLATAVVSALAALFLPILGAVLIFVAFSIVFWIAIYLFFTPHGIVRYRFGVARAMLESAHIVRWNLPGAVGFLVLAFVISWVTGLVWDMPPDGSWFALLALLGHAFVSATILAGSYAFYQGRHDWLASVRQAMVQRTQPPPGQGA